MEVEGTVGESGKISLYWDGLLRWEIAHLQEVFWRAIWQDEGQERQQEVVCFEGDGWRGI